MVIRDMNVHKQIRRTGDGSDRVEVAMNLTLSAYGRQPKQMVSKRKPKANDLSLCRTGRCDAQWNYGHL